MTNYANILDISGYWKDCPNWNKIQANFHAVIIRAGVGNEMDTYLNAYVTECQNRGIPYATYHIPKPSSLLSMTVEAQAEIYCTWPGVAQAVPIADLEPPHSNDIRMVSADEAQRYMAHLAKKHIRRPWWYSNGDCEGRLSYPQFLTGYKLWAAQYFYDQGTNNNLYTTFAEFLRERTPAFGPPLPSWVRGSIYEGNIVAWQFTSKGNAQDTAAYPGIAGADYSISTGKVVELKDFLGLLGPTAPALTIEQRLARLEGIHNL